jgi:hypothetical protein
MEKVICKILPRVLCKSFLFLICFIAVFTLFVLVMSSSYIHAYERYNDGCQNCHGAFFDETSPKGTIFVYQGNKLEMHRIPYDMETDCHMCHKNGDKNNPYLGKSAGHPPVPGIGCTGCHGREEDAGNDSVSNGLGAGLRQHHWNADRIINTESGSLSSQICADCHSDSDPANYTPVGEHVIPSFYGTEYTNADNPCNEVAQHNINENWDGFNFEGLDNDGDGIYDMNDPDCIADSLTVVVNTPLASSANGGDSNVQMQRLRLDCSKDGDEICVITAVTVHDTEVSTTGIIDSVKIYIDDDQNFGNGTLSNVRVNNWDGEATVVDLTSSISLTHRTVGGQSNRYILIIYNLNSQSDNFDIQSEVTAIDVLYPDNGVSGEWSSNRITISGPICPDSDNDGFSPDGGTCGPVDCNDNDNATFPGAQEICDNLDNDCDGVIDDITRPTTCGVGECTGNTGIETCTAGAWGGDTCDPLAGATAETCDNLDNDCDGAIDEDLTQHTTCGVGECGSTGVETCTAGTWGGDTCTSGTPSAEICDNLDNDCDGVVDDITRPTTCGVGKCTGNTGIETCTAGAWGGNTCDPLAGATAETCDNLDNDCDGAIDEDLTQPTTCGVGKCAGNTGTETCTAGVWSNDTCDPLAGSTAETCDNLDNDCDGAIDEDLTQPTTCGVGECAGNTGTETCTAGVWSNDTCDPLAGSTAETCDNLDNDCDGAIDEDLTQSTTCGVGKCAGNTGTETCTAGVWSNDTCDPLAGSTAETCDNLDNDCDGSSDEDFTNLGMTCTVGIGACESTGSYVCTSDELGTECNATPGTPGVEGPEGDPTCSDTSDNDCDGVADATDIDCQDCTDADNDGYYVGGNECGIKDCDDNDASINPGAPEICGDSVDNDCDKKKDDRDPEGCISCIPTGTPEDICNGIDDDCDEQIDEDYGVTSTTCGIGVCASTGQLECQGGQEVDTCTPGTTEAELCDSLDNDCDGSSDEDFTNLGMTCTVGIGACEATGNYVCTVDGLGTECDATQGTPGTEGPYGSPTCGDTVDNDCDGKTDAGDADCECVQTGLPDNNCDGIDDDCDGAPDDEYVTTPTTCGTGECASTGQLECQGGTEVDTCLEGTPSPELCDGLDNDCDSSVDEDFTDLGGTCTVGVGACEETGTYICSADGSGTECSATPDIPGVEGPVGHVTCSDNVDNDCDGQTDLSDSDCTCIPTGTPESVCNGIDDDCDSSIDEDYVSTSTSCGVGECASTGQTTCAGGVEGDTCTPGTPSIELCDGLDNDCDGSSDEDFTNLGTTCTVGVGACEKTGTYICMLDGSGTECDASPRAPGVEGPEGDPTCTDNIDNDCDGQADINDVDCGGECTPPPVRQEIGIQDVLYNNLVESDCRFCHENPEQFPVLDVSIPDRHHLLEGNVIPDPTDAPFANPGELYECLSCHEVDTSSGEIVFIVERDCLVCHIQDPSELTVHHRTDLAQGTLPQGPDCQACHGDIVDNRDDGHFIPTFDPLPETPKRSGGTGLPFNSRGDGAGACDYCHNDGICPPEVIPVETNMTTHHNTGLGSDPIKCDWCHDFSIPFEAQFRICENCHGRDSLHNIQADSDGDGVINPGIEQPFYGHIGNPDDCWGCHGYGPSASSIAPESGPIVPVISSISNSVLIEGTDTTVTLTGAAFTNMDEGIELSSDVVLIAPDGSSTTLIPDFISQDSITVTVPGSLGKGNYKVKAAKLDKYSNPKVISVKPSVGIVDIDCKKRSGQLEITGSGFGDKPDGTDDYLTVEVNGQIVDVISWTDTVITVAVTSCKGNLSVTVNALFGSATSQ